MILRGDKVTIPLLAYLDRLWGVPAHVHRFNHLWAEPDDEILDGIERFQS